MFKTNSLGIKEARSIKFYEILTGQLKWMFFSASATPTFNNLHWSHLNLNQNCLNKLPSCVCFDTVFLRDSLLIYPKSKVQLTFFTFIEMIRNSPQPCPILKTLYSVIYNFKIPFNNNSTYNN